MIRSQKVFFKSPYSSMGISKKLSRMGDATDATSYTFTDGLSSDARLPAWLQDLTPAQLQNALNGGAPSIQDMLGPGSTVLASCSNPAQYDPTICGPGGASATSPLLMNNLLPSLGSVPTWVWYAGIGTIAALFLIPKGGR
jgi:hypothetical protein